MLFAAALLSATMTMSISPSSSNEFQDEVSEVARLFQGNPRLKRLSPSQRQELLDFVTGNLVFVVLHEIGHALISDMQIPMLGPEEDAADYFAIVELLEIGSELSHRVLVDAAEGWFLNHRRGRREKEPLYFHNEHGLDKQRAYRIVCIMVGSDPEGFKDLARDTNLPEDRQETCRRDYESAVSSWRAVLQAHLRSGDQSRTMINVAYGNGNGKFDMFAKGFSIIRLLNVLADHISDELVFPQSFTLDMETCGVINAAWFASARKVTLCYELADDFAHLYREYGSKPTSVSRKRKAK
jgi:putative metallopeptidase DUF4344